MIDQPTDYYPAPKGYFRRHLPWFIGLGLIVALVVGISIGTSHRDPAPTQEAPPAVTPGALAPVPTPAPVPGTIPGDGTFTVGKDVAPGTYRSAGSPDGYGCYWSRNRDASGDIGSIIANDDVMKGPAMVVIKATDGVFKTVGCQVWTKVS